MAKNIAKRVAKTGGLAGMDAPTLMAILSGDPELQAKIAATPANKRARLLERELAKKNGMSAADVNKAEGKKPRTGKKRTPRKGGGESGKGVINPSARPTNSTNARAEGMLIAKRAYKAMKKATPFEQWRVMTAEQKVQVLLNAVSKDKTITGEVAEGVIIGVQQRIAKFPDASPAGKLLENFGTERGVKSAKRAITTGSQASAGGEKRRVAARRRGAGSTVPTPTRKGIKSAQAYRLSSVEEILARDAARNDPKTRSEKVAAKAAQEEAASNSENVTVKAGKPGKPLFGGAPIKFARYDGKVLKEVVDWKNIKDADLQLIARNISREPFSKGISIIPLIQDLKTGEWNVASQRKTDRLARIFDRSRITGKLTPIVGEGGKLETPVPLVGDSKGKLKDTTPLQDRKEKMRIQGARGRRVNREYTDAALIDAVKANQEKARTENRKMLDRINREIKKAGLTGDAAKAAKKAAMVKFHQEKNPIASPAQIARDILGVDDPAMVRRVARIMRAERMAPPAATPSTTKPKRKRVMVLKPQDPDAIKAAKKAKEQRIVDLKNDPSPAAPEPKPIMGKAKATRIARSVLKTGTFEGPAIRAPRQPRTARPVVGDPRPGVLSRESILAQLEDPADKRQMKKVMKLSRDFTPAQMRTLEKRGVIKVSPKVKSAAKNLGMMGFVVGVLSQLGDTRKRRG